MKPHKHADIIKAWADGAEVQAYEGKKWVDVNDPSWVDTCEYRIKPDEPKPPVVRWLWFNEYCEVTQKLYSEDEIESLNSDLCYEKLEWSRTEFSE
jgi:hypothetical protein